MKELKNEKTIQLKEKYAKRLEKWYKMCITS